MKALKTLVITLLAVGSLVLFGTKKASACGCKQKQECSCKKECNCKNNK